MKVTDSLKKHITGAYLAFACGATLLLSVIAAVAVEGIEQRLVDNRLSEVAHWASPRHDSGLSVAMPTGLSFYHGDAIPVSLRKLPDGVSEVFVDGISLHVLSGSDTRGRFVVVDHESDYANIELVVYSMFGGAFLGLVVLSLVLGRHLGRRLVHPISELAGAVRAGGRAIPFTQRGDEIGVLARAFAAHTSQLREFLDRERHFTGDVSHELRTPLTVIIGAAEILIEQGGDDPDIARPAERVLRAANEATQCVSIMLMLARAPEAAAFEAIDIAAVAAAEVGRHQALVSSKDVQLRFQGGETFLVRAVPGLLAAAIGNLVRNACQYTLHGEVLVYLHEHALIVEDSGPGLPSAVRLAVTRGSGSHAVPSTSGSGLGLGLVTRICESIGATLQLDHLESGGVKAVIQFQPVSQNLNAFVTPP